jgi:hypothetical protein
MLFIDLRALALYWWHAWGLVARQLFVNLGALSIGLAVCWTAVRYAQELFKTRSPRDAVANTGQYFRDNVLTPVLAMVCLFIVCGIAVAPYRSGQEERSKTNVHDQNVIGAIRAFATFRYANPSACHIKLTAPPPGETFAIQIAGLAAVGPDCEVYGPFPTKASVELDREATTGMVPHMVVFHALKTDQTANTLFDSLSMLLPLKRSFDIPQDSPPNFVWLQFGTDVKWNSEH